MKAQIKKLFYFPYRLGYKYVLKYDNFLSNRIEKILIKIEHKYKRGDMPLPKKEWEEQYSGSRWNFLESLEQVPRYGVLVGLLKYFAYDGKILDVGCGTGILYQRFKTYDYSRFVGIDISEVAIEKLSALNNHKNQFLCADGEDFTTSEKFDAIVFNESIYYFGDPITALEKYQKMLNEKGVLIISTFGMSVRATEILKVIKSRYQLLTEAKVMVRNKSWIFDVFTEKASSEKN